jgi:hypothetical protein
MYGAFGGSDMRIVGRLGTGDSQAQSASPSDNGYWPGLGGVGTVVTLVIAAIVFVLFLIVWARHQYYCSRFMTTVECFQTRAECEKQLPIVESPYQSGCWNQDDPPPPFKLGH